jgi:transposase
MMRLTDQEIKKRFVRLQNLERLYPIARKRIEKLEKENKELKRENQELRAIVMAQAEIIEKFRLRIEELEIKIFGKKKNKDRGQADKDKNTDSESQTEKKPRPADSYRKPIPGQKEITKTQEYPIADCPDCNAPLTDLKTITQYKIELAFLDKILKEIECQHVQSGYCPKCKKRVSAIPIQPQTVYFGPSLKQFVCHSIIILRLSFSQTEDLIKTIADIDVSEGEISSILQEHSEALKPEFERIKKQIQNEPAVHFDETTYKVFSEKAGGNYGWIMASAKTNDAIFAFGKNRGLGNAKDLKGSGNPDQIGVTDNYAGYKNLFGQNHQLCWAHLIRKFRELAESGQLPEDKKEYCAGLHQSLKGIFHELDQTLCQPFDLEMRLPVKESLLGRLQELSKSNTLDCAKLKTVKETLAADLGSYFTCLLHQGVPATNNKAEQLLRHAVIKRKLSFGFKTQKGADAASILFSVLLSLWRRSKQNFFAGYRQLLEESRVLRALPQ